MALDDVQAMNRSIDLACAAKIHGNGPYGSVITLNGAIVGEGENTVRTGLDCTAHAEIVAVRDAMRRLGRLDLSDCVLYASTEPCVMCAAAIRWARIKRVVFAIPDNDFGGFTTPFAVLQATTVQRLAAPPVVVDHFMTAEALDRLPDFVSVLPSN